MGWLARKEKPPEEQVAQGANIPKGPVSGLVSLLRAVTEKYKPARTGELLVVPQYQAEHRGIAYQVEQISHQYPIAKVVDGQGIDEAQEFSWFEAVILGYPITDEQLQKHNGVPAYLFPGWHELPRQSVPVRLVEVEGSYRWVRKQDTLPELEADVRQTINFLYDDGFIQERKS